MTARQGSPPHILPLSREGKLEAIEVLALAFHEYPVMRYVLKDAGDDYDLLLRELIGFFVESRLSRGWPLLGIKQDDRLVAVAAANSPGKKQRPEGLQDVYNHLSALMLPAATQRLEAFERASSGLAPEGSYYYLGMIGVLPAFQGKGLARQLIDHLHSLSEGDPASSGVCLSTENPANVPIYRHLGYEVVGEVDCGEIHTWVMFRPDR